jgi:hypothetical protein
VKKYTARENEQRRQPGHAARRGPGTLQLNRPLHRLTEATQLYWSQPSRPRDLPATPPLAAKRASSRHLNELSSAASRNPGTSPAGHERRTCRWLASERTGTKPLHGSSPLFTGTRPIMAYTPVLYNWQRQINIFLYVGTLAIIPQNTTVSHSSIVFMDN